MYIYQEHLKNIKHMIEEKEEWRDVVGYEGLYMVSNIGNVKSLKRTAKSKNGSIRTVSEKLRKIDKNKSGYLMVILNKEGKRKGMKIHRLVADAFIKNPYNLPQVNHRNEIKSDNRVENLEWCTQDYNNKYGTRTERTSKKVKCLETGKIYPSLSEVQRQFGFSAGHICECCNGKRNICGGFHWQYV